MRTPLLTPAEAASEDRLALSGYGLRPELLMENAARAALACLQDEFGELAGLDVILLAGPGNNGGDALTLARHLLDAGAVVQVLTLKPLGSYRREAGYHARLAARCGVPVKALSRLRAGELPHLLAGADLIVDGLLGTGFRGPLRPELRGLIDTLNAAVADSGATLVLALDIPSGLDGTSGEPGPVAVRADLTVTFGSAKLGLVLPPAAPYVGRLEVRDIGIPARVRQATQPKHFLLDESVWDLLPLDSPDMHKGAAGRVLICGGSPGLTGASALAALGALRAGAGLVTVAAPAGLTAEIKSGHPDIMTLPLPGGQAWGPEAAPDVLARVPGLDALVLGPGLGRDAGAAAFLAAVLDGLGALSAPPPLVVDADALWHLGHATAFPAGLGPCAVFTPHPGEMAGLCGLDAGQVQAARIEVAREFAARHNLTLILKGAGSLVAEGSGRVYISAIAAPNLAVGGSGDVLSGLLACLLARGLTPVQAACLAVHWHAAAGLDLAGRFPGRGNLASEIAETLPHIPHLLDDQETECTC